MIEQGGGNCRVPDFPGLIVKKSYWRWPERNQSGDKCVSLGGNAIDCHTQILRWSFHDAMRALTRT